MWFGFFYALGYLFWTMIYFAWRGNCIYGFLDCSKPVQHFPSFHSILPSHSLLRTSVAYRQLIIVVNTVMLQGWPVFYTGIPVLWVVCFACWVPVSRSCRRCQNRQQLPRGANGIPPSLLHDGGRRGSVQNLGWQSANKGANGRADTAPLLGGEQA